MGAAQPDTDPVMAVVRAQRLAQGLSLQRLAALIGSGYSNLSLAERGGQSPTLHQLRKILGGLGLDLEVVPARHGLVPSGGPAVELARWLRDFERAEDLADRIETWLADWPDTAVTDPYLPLAMAILFDLSAAIDREWAAEVDRVTAEVPAADGRGG
jgi:transcriptional regulator with XRE-family HTH domain